MTPARRSPARGVLAGVESTIAAMRAAGRLEPVDDAVVELARSTARALEAAELDETTGYGELSAVARAHLAALDRLSCVGAGSSEPDAIERLLAELSGPVGDRARRQP